MCACARIRSCGAVRCSRGRLGAAELVPLRGSWAGVRREESLDVDFWKSAPLVLRVRLVTCVPCVNVRFADEKKPAELAVRNPE